MIVDSEIANGREIGSPCNTNENKGENTRKNAVFQRYNHVKPIGNRLENMQQFLIDKWNLFRPQKCLSVQKYIPSDCGCHEALTATEGIYNRR